MFQKQCGDPNLPRPNLNINVTQGAKSYEVVKDGLDSGKKVFGVSGEMETSLSIATSRIEDEKCVWRRKTKLGYPKLVYSGRNIRPKILNFLNKTGEIDVFEKKPLNLNLDFGCKGKEGKTNLTIQIEMRYFKDISINIEVSCESNLGSNPKPY